MSRLLVKAADHTAVARDALAWPAGHVLLEGAALASLLALALLGRLANPDHYSGSFDEGIRAQQLLLMDLGYRPFRDIFASQGPLLLDLLYPLYRLFGGTLGAIRLGVGIWSLLGIVGAWWALRAVHPLAGLVASGLLVLSPVYLESSRLALAEVPSLAPALWAIGCGLRWQRGGAAGWAVAAALLGCLSLLVKPMALSLAAPLLLLALLRRPLRPGKLALAGLAGLALGLVSLLLLDAPRVLEVLGAYRLGAQRQSGSDALDNLTLVWKVLGAERPGLLALVIVGRALGARLWPRPTLALAGWLLAQLGLFLVYTDLADKHIVYLLPPLAQLGGLAGAGTVVALASLLRSRQSGWAAAAAAGLLALGVYAALAPGLWRAGWALADDTDERARRDYAGTRAQAELMAGLSGPDDWVLTDHPLAAFEARRPMPPWLVDTSGTRIDAGALTSEQVIQEVEQYRPTVIVTLRRRLGKLEAFRRWLADHYVLLQTYPGSDPSTPLQLYVRPDLEPTARKLLAGRG